MPTTTNTPGVTESKQYWTEAQTAEVLGISPATLRTWRCLGRGPRFIKVGRSVRYREDLVHGWASKQIRG